jgi:hypothetical protein
MSSKKPASASRVPAPRKTGCRYPAVKVRLSGGDGNAFAIMGQVLRALKDAGVSAKEQNLFCKQAMSGSYLELLATCCKWVQVR